MLTAALLYRCVAECGWAFCVCIGTATFGLWDPEAIAAGNTQKTAHDVCRLACVQC
jgi:hypothetical protein